MKFLNFIKFLFGPRKYVRDLVSKKTEGWFSQIQRNEFLIPIDDCDTTDVFIAGFPKSGNTWMQSLISGTIYGIDGEYLTDRLAQEIVPDVHARKYYKRFGQMNFFKTHHLPKPHYRKIIYLVRDGRDAMVSYYHFLEKLGNKITLSDMVISGKGIFPALWHEHVQSYLNNPYNAEILFIKYEDLLKNALSELKKICEFVSIERSEDLLMRVIEGNHIDKMRMKAKKYGGMGHIDWIGDKGVEFFRKGKIGEYQKEMSEELILRFNELSKKQLQFFEYKLNGDKL